MVDTAVAGIAALLGGLSLKVSLPKGFDPVPLWCSEKYNDIYSNSEMHIVEGENHLIINKRKEVIGIILNLLSKDSNREIYKCYLIDSKSILSY